MNFPRRTGTVCAATLPILLSACTSSSSNDVKVETAITTQSVSASLVTGSNSVLSVVAKGDGLTYQWYKDGSAVANATTPVYVATAASSYYVVVTSTAGAMTSTAAVLTETTAPVIVT